MRAKTPHEIALDICASEKYSVSRQYRDEKPSDLVKTGLLLLVLMLCALAGRLIYQCLEWIL